MSSMISKTAAGAFLALVLGSAAEAQTYHRGPYWQHPARQGHNPGYAPNSANPSGGMTTHLGGPAQGTPGDGGMSPGSDGGQCQCPAAPYPHRHHRPHGGPWGGNSPGYGPPIGPGYGPRIGPGYGPRPMMPGGWIR